MPLLAPLRESSALRMRCLNATSRGELKTPHQKKTSSQWHSGSTSSYGRIFLERFDLKLPIRSDMTTNRTLAGGRQNLSFRTINRWASRSAADASGVLMIR